MSRRRRLDRPERLDDVPAEPGVRRRRDLVRLQRERDLLELRVERALRVRVLAAGRLRPRILRVLLHEGDELRGILLQLPVETLRERLVLDEDVPDVAALLRRRDL